MTKPTHQVVCAARRMLTHGVPMERVLRNIGGDHTEAEITDALIELRERVKRTRKSRAGEVTGWRGIVEFKPVEVPLHVVAERDRRSNLKPRSLSALHFGDPLPGYSALDLPRVSERSSDPLDCLIFRRGKTTPRTGARYG